MPADGALIFGAPTAPFPIPIPSNGGLIGQTLDMRGLVLAASGRRLTNGLDVTIGSFRASGVRIRPPTTRGRRTDPWT